MINHNCCRVSMIFPSRNVESCCIVLNRGSTSPTLERCAFYSPSTLESSSTLFFVNKLRETEPKRGENFREDSSICSVFRKVLLVFHSHSYFCFLGVNSISIYFYPIFWYFGMPSWANFRDIVEFQWFLIALSVLPGRYLEMRAHLFPNLKYYKTITSDGIR